MPKWFCHAVQKVILSFAIMRILLEFSFVIMLFFFQENICYDYDVTAFYASKLYQSDSVMHYEGCLRVQFRNLVITFPRKHCSMSAM